MVHPTELQGREQATWRAFQASNPLLDNPFLTPEFTLAVGQLRADARVALLEEEDVVGFFPFERRRAGFGRPIGAGMSDCQALVVPGDVPVDGQTLLRACRLAIWRFDHLLTPHAKALRSRSVPLAAPVIDLRKGYEAYLGERRQASRSLLESTARKARKLAREVGELRFVADERDHDRLEQLITWKRDQYRRTGVPDVLAPAPNRELLHRLLDTRATAFSGLLSVLYAGERAVAAHMGARTATGVVWWLPAYDAGCSSYSPGLTLVLRLAEWAAADGVEWIDLGKGAELYKQRLKSRDRFVADGYVAQPFVGPLFDLARRVAGRTGADVPENGEGG